MGVDLFFVLSGFLVSGLLITDYQRHHRLSIGRFIIRRGWKIYPPFLVLILFTVVHAELNDVTYKQQALLSEIFFFQSYVTGLWWHTWSLSVEEHFYLLLPLAFVITLLMNKRSPTPLSPLVPMLAFVAVVDCAARLLLASQLTYSHMAQLFPSYLRMDALGFGVAISYFYHFHRARFVTLLTPWRVPLAVSGLALLVPPFAFVLDETPFLYTIGLTTNYLGSGMLMTAALMSDFSSSRFLKSLGWLGAFSYSIYLWHLPVGQLGIPALVAHMESAISFKEWFALYLFGSLAAGVLMARLVEIPSLILRDRLFPSPSPIRVANEQS